jgi:signal transduction histidine kinase
LVVGLGTLGLVGVAGLALGGVALRPLQALRDTAERVASTGDLGARVPEGSGPEEVDALAGSLNAMLARLERSTATTRAALEASRRFAADAGHELRTPLTSMQTNLDVLLAAPDLPEAERARILADVAREQRRVVALLDALQTLARGDSAAAARREPVDLADIVDAAVQAARARHPQSRVAFHDPGEMAMSRWRDGLRVLVDNLLENALRHGRPGGRVEVFLVREGASMVLLVDDDGPGIPPDERERVFERFVRGRGARATGSGLGLALVAQQAALHGGAADIEDAPGGGTRVRVRLAVGHEDGDRPAQAAR